METHRYGLALTHPSAPVEREPSRSVRKICALPAKPRKTTADATTDKDVALFERTLSGGRLFIQIRFVVHSMQF